MAARQGTMVGMKRIEVWRASPALAILLFRTASFQHVNCFHCRKSRKKGMSRRIALKLNTLERSTHKHRYGEGGTL